MIKFFGDALGVHLPRFLCLCFVVPSQSVLAARVDHETTLRTASSYSQNPNDTDLYPNSSETNQQFLIRESVKIQAARNTRIEINVYNLILGSGDKQSLAQTLLSASDERNRTSWLERHYHDSHQLDGYLAVDRLSIRTKVAGTESTVGRFAINLSSMSIFTPNDFFAPYRPFDYYREYKPGVDALRIDYGLGRKSQVSVIAVAGYDTPAAISRVSPALGKSSSHFSPNVASAIARGTYTLRGFEGALIGGKLGSKNLIGFSIQGELGPVGVRAEGHQTDNRLRPERRAQGVVGFEARLSSRLIVIGEQFYNGGGYVNPADYASVATNPTSDLLLGRFYTGLAANFELTPLNHLKALFIINDLDQSVLTSLNCAYSVAENAELVLSLLSPRGKGPDKLLMRSEFGTYPGILSVQAGVYF